MTAWTADDDTPALNRRRFMTSMAGIGVGVVVVTGSEAIARPVAMRPVTVLANAFLAGMAYYDFPDGPGDAFEAGQELVLKREPDNPYDDRAIEVFLPDGRKLGYVARRENEALSRLMDAGVSVRATVREVGEGPYSVTMRIDVLLPAGSAGA